MSIEDDVETIEGAGLLTERQAKAYVLRDIELVPRDAAADGMGISVNTLDNLLAAARGKVEAAEETVDAIASIRFEELPTECEVCELTLDGVWSRDDDGNAICLDCADIERPLSRESGWPDPTRDSE